MKINFISFLDPTTYSGGGEMISKGLIDVGLKRGHDIRISSVRPNKFNSHASPDLVFFIDVFNNAHTLKSLGAWRAFPKNYISNAMKSVPFVHLTNAYVDICNLPYLPCSGNSCPICPAKKELSLLDKLIIKDFSNNCFATRSIVKELYENSALNIYLSPLHKQITEKVLNISKKESFVLKPLIDTKRFFNEGLTRDIEYLFVGIIGEAKGFYEMREKFKNEDIHLIGKISKDVKLDFGTHYGHLNYNEIPRYMNRAKNFVFMPRWPEPQGRVVVEAALCGCNIIGNNNVGALSFDMDLADPVNFAGAEEELWLQIEKI
jgi:glycosyltransferase involved in cell wall biosynthesis